MLAQLRDSNHDPENGRFTSLPDTIRIFRSTSGRMIYSLDKPVVTNGTFGVTERHGAGFFNFQR